MQNVRVKYTIDSADVRKADRDLDNLLKSDKELIAQVKRLNAEAARTGKAFTDSAQKAKNANNQTKKDLDGIGQGLNKLGSLISGAFAVGTLVSFGQKVISITSEFQKLQAVLATALGSGSAGQAAFLKIQDFAARTNFSVLELTDSFVKLTNAGFEPTTRELENLADLANSTGKGFDQLTEAIIDAQTGEFERLKEFGIRASKEGDKVTFTFKGVQKQVDFTSQSIQDYIVGLGKLNGVSGTTAQISETLGGAISNLGDAIDNLFASIGNSTSGIGARFIRFLTDATNQAARFFKTIDEEVKDEQIVKVSKAVEEINEALASGIDLYKRQGKSAEEAAALAKKSLQEGITERLVEARKRLEDFNNAFDSQSLNVTELDRYIERIPFLAESVETAVDVQTKYRLAVIATEGDVKALEAQLKALQKEAEKEIKPVDKKGLEELRKLLEDYRKLTGDLDLEFFKSKNALRESLFGEDDIIVVQRNAVAAREALTREFQQAYKKIQADGEKLVKAGLLSRNQLDIDLNLRTETFQTELAEAASEFDKFVEKFKLKGKELQNPFTDLEKRVGQYIDNTVEKTDRELEKRREAEELRRELLQESYDLGVSLVNSFFEISSNRRDAELEAVRQKEQSQLKLVGDNQQAQDFIREAARQRERQIRIQQAKSDKAQALFNIGANTAVAIIKTIAQLGIPAGIPFAAIAAAQGAIQAAIVASKPIPKFKDGVLDLKGPGTATSDSIPAMLSRGESVMTAQESKDYMPTLRAIREGSVPPELLNAIARPNYDTLEKAAPAMVMLKENAQTLDKLDRIEKALRKQKNVNLNFDRRGFTAFVQSGDNVTKILNNQFPK